MEKEMLDMLNDLSEKPTTELALQIMELSSENLSLKQQNKKAIEYINTHERKDEFLELNEWQTRELLHILEDKEV